MLSKNRKINKYILNVPKNICLSEENKVLSIKNVEKNYELKVPIFTFLQINYLPNVIEVSIIPNLTTVKHAQIMLITFSSKLRHQLKGVSELYTGIITIKGLGYSVNVTKKNDKFHLFFRFGFKDTYNYIMPDNINIENYEKAKVQLIISTYSLELLKEVQKTIQRFRKPKAYKLQGIYIDNILPKVKKYVK